MLQSLFRTHTKSKRAAVSSALFFSGCATAAPPATPTTPTADAVELAALRDAQEGSDERIQELESRLALARAEAADLRTAAQDQGSAAPVRDTVRIGASRHAAQNSDEDWVEPWEEGVWREPELAAAAPRQEPAESGPRPVLRLHGTPEPEEWTQQPLLAAGSLPPIPTQVPLRLPVAGVAPLPAPAAPSFLRATGSPRPSSPDAAVARYRAALGHVRDREFAEALAGFDAFLEAHPRHPYVQNAMYWRGEVLYARRAYRRAKGAFMDVVRQFPRGSKVPEALLKVALCYTRLGDEEGAARVIARLRRDYPNSVAARTTGAEGSGS